MSAGPELPRHTRRQPPEWEGLLAHTTDIIGEAANALGDVDMHVAQEALEVTADLPNDTLERNRYYGLGIVTCHLMRLLYDPETQEDIINEGARQLKQTSKALSFMRGEWEYQGIRLNDLGIPLDITAYELVPTIKESLPPAERALADSLETTALIRCEEYQNKARGVLLTRKRHNGRYSAAIGTVIENLLEGSLETYYHGLTKLSNKGHAVARAHRELHNPLIHEFIDPVELGGMDLDTVGVNIASIRHDEISMWDQLAQCIGVPTAGKRRFTFDRSGIPPHPGEPLTRTAPDGRPFLHEERLRCPALNVQGAIPVAMQLVPKIITRAQEMVAAEQVARQQATL